MLGRGPEEQEHVSRGGLGRRGLGCSFEIQAENKDGEGKERCELQDSAGMGTAYHNSALIISCLENTASSAGWSIVLLGHLLQVKPQGQGRRFAPPKEDGLMWLIPSPVSNGSGRCCTNPREDLIFFLKQDLKFFFNSVHEVKQVLSVHKEM